MAQNSLPLFRNLTADDSEPELTELESVCLNCQKDGCTRILLTKIPLYKEIIVISFTCDHCGYTNNETQFGGKFQDKGIKCTVLVQNEKDLSRQIVKSDFASVTIPEVDLEIPAQTHKGEITTVEGFINRVIIGLQQDQTKRKELTPDVAAKIESFIVRLEKLKSLNIPFHLILDDPSGNSFIQNPVAPAKDDGTEVIHYSRSKEHNKLMGLMTEDDDCNVSPAVDDILESEVVTFQTNCYACNSPCETRMKPTKIPHFKEVIIMATNCDACGHRSNEVKSGAGIEPQGIRINLHITNSRDLYRDVLKSDTCSILIPELELEAGGGTLGGRFTTVEGLLVEMKKQLSSNNPLVQGDSGDPEQKTKMAEFLRQLQNILTGVSKVHLILDDPAGNSYVENLQIPESDPQLDISYYERSFDQNEELGLNDMKVENYETNESP